jgi:hypothetical protein
VSVDSFRQNFLEEGGKRGNGSIMCLLGTICWFLWLNRKEWVFNDKIISAPCVIVYRLISFMQRWRILSNGQGRRELEEIIDKDKEKNAGGDRA